MKLGQILGELKGPLYRHVEAGERAKREERRARTADSLRRWQQKRQHEQEKKRREELNGMGFRPV